MELRELIDSREWSVGDGDTVILTFSIEGTADDAEAKEFFETNAPPKHAGLDRQTYTMEPDGIDTIEGVGRWKCEATYAKNRVTIITGGSTANYSFDTGGGTQHITQARSTIDTYVPVGKTKPDFKGAINVTKDSVNGVDITSPIYNFGETHYFSAVQITGSYKAMLFNLTGKVNADGFRGFMPGEVLFLGASGSQSGDDEWEITYRFAASQNRYNFNIGDILVPIKRGWDYMWVQYRDAVDANANKKVKVPAAVTINVVYEMAYLGALGI